MFKIVLKYKKKYTLIDIAEISYESAIEVHV